MTDSRIPKLVEALRSNDSRSRRAAVTELGKMGAVAREAAEALSEILLSNESQIRWNAAQILRNVGVADGAAIVNIIQAHGHKDSLGRTAATYAMGGVSPEAAPAAPAICALLTDELPAIREAAVFALGKIGPGAKTAYVRLRAMENDPDANVRRQVMVAIVAVGPRDAENDTVNPMREEIAKDKRLIADEARLARGEISLDQLEAGRSVIAMLSSEQTMVRRAGAIALGSGGADENTLMHLAEALKDKREKVREAAAFALGQIGPDAASAAPSLLEALKDHDDKVRKAAFFAIHRIVRK